MAQGYLECSIETQPMEDVGDQYIKILLMRSFFQDASLSEYIDITCLKMYVLMHDLAKSVAGNDFYLDSEKKGVVGRPMHASFISSTTCSLDSLDASKLRTILWAKTDVGFVGRPSIMKNLMYLRVLDLSYSFIAKLPESIVKLKHLRYLDLSYCGRLIGLPHSIGNLVNLQTLKLRSCYSLVFCVEVITKLINLRHLDIKGCKAFKYTMPTGLGKLTSLLSLSNFEVGDDKNSKSGKIKEMKELNNIRGHLSINNLGLVKDMELESQEANMKAKKYIQGLTLYWGEDEYPFKVNNKNSDSLQLLDNFCPHQNIKELIVGGYPGVRFSSWLHSLTNIVEISLQRFPNCQHLPPLERFPWLKKLTICEMSKLKYMHYEKISHVLFPSLEILVLQRCKNMKGWQRLADTNNTNDIGNHLSLPPFPRLSYLDITYCPNLTCMLSFPYLVHLFLHSSNVKPMIETYLVQFQLSSFYPLSSIKKSLISEADIEAMPKKWMQNIMSLKHLSVSPLPIIAPLLRHLQHVPTELEELYIQYVGKLDLWKNEEGVSTQCQALHQLASIVKISIQSFFYLTAFPEWICDLKSVRHIEIMYSPNLESLAEWMRYLTNLQRHYVSFIVF